MILHIITEQLAKKLPKRSKLRQYNIVNPTNFTQIHKLLKSDKINAVHITDSTSSTSIEPQTIIPVKNHINKTGTNILTGKQKLMDIDFIDLTNPYIHKRNSIITNCCGKSLNNIYEYPSHYICHITTLAKAMNIKNIHGFLFNTI